MAITDSIFEKSNWDKFLNGKIHKPPSIDVEDTGVDFVTGIEGIRNINGKHLDKKVLNGLVERVSIESKTRLEEGIEQNKKDLQTKEEEPKKVPFKRAIVWKNALGFLVLHLLAAYGVCLVFTSAKIVTTIWSLSLLLIGGFGVTAGAHRLWSHRSYKAKLPFKLFLLFGQTLAGQNCLWVWVRDHRQHHRFSDTDADPHNARNGFFFSHVGWLMSRKHPEVISKGKTIDMSDLEADPWVMFQKNHYKKLYALFALIVPVSVPILLWGEDPWVAYITCFFMRFMIQINLTWLVNSYAHMFGTRPYTKDILPVESSLVSFFGLGEGWHNYHHTFPWDYRAAEYGKHFNLTLSILDYCAKKGWIYDMRSATEEMVKMRVVNKGDKTHPKWGLITTTDYY